MRILYYKYMSVVLMYLGQEWKNDLKLYISYNNGFVEGVIPRVLPNLLLLFGCFVNVHNGKELCKDVFATASSRCS